MKRTSENETGMDVADRQPPVDVMRDRLYRRIAVRVMPLLVICYIVSFIDRTNIGIAQVGLKRDLGFSATAYGLGVALFFVGFILFEVPSNAMLQRIGARATLTRIMVTWGIVTVGTMFVWDETSFYVMRFLLGVAEAGFFPGALFYLAQWFPSARRTSRTATFFIGVPISGIIGSAVSGWIMSAFNGDLGLADWQWLFLLEGIPPVLLGAFVWFYLCDRPADARWLTDDEKAVVEADLSADQADKARAADAAQHTGLRAALRDPRVLILGLCACGAYTLANAVSFWTPRIINNAGVDNVLNIGLFSAIPPIAGIIVMQIVGRSSDRRLERRWHAAGSWLVASGGLIALSLVTHSPHVVVVLLAVIAAAHYAGLTVFYSIPSIYLSGRGTATAIALVTSMGSFAAALSPAMLGFIEDHTGSLSLGLQISAAIIVCAAVLLLVGIPAKALKENTR